MSNKTKLELTWIVKEARPKLEPRILLEDRGESSNASHRVTDQDMFDNRLIFGGDVGQESFPFAEYWPRIHWSA